MEAVILAAGLGTRLRPLTDDRPKCLVEVHGVSILVSQLDALRNHGIRKTVVVVGNRSDQVVRGVGIDYRGMEVAFVENAAFETTGTARSFLAGAAPMGGAFFLLEGDVVFDPIILTKLDEAARAEPDVVQTAVTPFAAPLEGSTVALDGDGGVLDIRRGCAVGTCPDRFKTINIHLFAEPLAHAVKASLARFVEDAAPTASLEDFFGRSIAARSFQMRGVDCQGVEWIEIDTPEDHQLASARTWLKQH